MADPIRYSKVFLIILDGFGLADEESGNAILAAKMPYMNSLIARYPAMSIAASGLVVGLPWGQPGNSEVGHSAIGTGRIVVQDLAHINGEIRSGNFYKNPALLGAVLHAKKYDSALHVMGCTSPGGIHSHVDHLIALIELAYRHGLKKIFVHFIADGQDMPAKDAINVVATLEPYLKKSGARIASIAGRSFAMDRVLNWKLTQQVWRAVVVGDGPPISDISAYIQDNYDKGVTDYALEPATVTNNGAPIGPVEDNDAFIFFDFRNDRVKQLATPFLYVDTFKEFDPVRRPKNLNVVTMTRYSEDFTAPVAYPPIDLPQTLGEVVSRAGLGQWRIAEKEKEAHVTNFFNGGRILPFEGEQRDIVPSRPMRGDQYLVHPEMSAAHIVQSVLEKMNDDAGLYVINFANPDMIGHTGNFEATKRALKITDDALKKIIEEISQRNDSAVVITADHGNAEELIDPLTGGEDTQHSTRTVPVIFVAPELKTAEDTGKSLETLAQEAPLGTLIDIAPSVLSLLGIDKPREMTGSRLAPLG
jgi:2,3-bisphosphoglycerate-independent phosphoglycerate mutase